MTTVAYRDGVLAFDSLVTEGKCRVGTFQKGRMTKKLMMAGAGNLEDLVAIMDWIEAGAVFDDKKKFNLDRKLDASVITINKKGVVIIYEDNLIPYDLHDDFYALGNGSDLARGAMAFGASAKEAVKIAARYNVYTGGAIKTLSFKNEKAPKTQSKD